jgi:hypothetical protein
MIIPVGGSHALWDYVIWHDVRAVVEGFAANTALLVLPNDFLGE